MKAPGLKFINHQSAVLGGFALMIGFILWLFDIATSTQINHNRQAQLSQSLSQVLADRWVGNDLTSTRKTIFDTALQFDRTIYTATKNKQPTAAIISAHATDGYAGDIDLLVGILIDGSIAGVRVTQHQETPGLGDDIELRKSNWILDFDGTSLSAPTQWAVKRDGGSFDQFTGATITPRAVVSAVKQTLEFFNQHQAEIFSTIND